MPTHPQTNQAALSDLEVIANLIINATPTGSTDDVVLRFDTPPTGVVGTAWSETITAAAGSVLTCSTQGIYYVSFSLGFTGAVAVAAGIGINMATAPITADPVVGVDGVIKAGDMLMVASSIQVYNVATTILVTAAQAAAGLTLRFLASNSAGAAPAGVIAGSVAYRILKLANTPF